MGCGVYLRLERERYHREQREGSFRLARQKAAMMGIQGIEVLTRPDDPDLKDENREKHIVGPKYTDEGKIPGSVLVTEAMVNGTPVTALCGFVWVPSRNPDNYPLCPACKSIVERQGD